MTVATEGIKVTNLEKNSEVVRLSNEEALRSFFAMVRLQTTAWTSKKRPAALST